MSGLTDRNNTDGGATGVEENAIAAFFGFAAATTAEQDLVAAEATIGVEEVIVTTFVGFTAATTAEQDLTATAADGDNWDGNATAAFVTTTANGDRFGRIEFG